MSFRLTDFLAPIPSDFRCAHRCILPGSSVEDAVEAAWSAFDPVQKHVRGILLSPAIIHLQVKETVFRTRCSLFVMIPPRSVRMRGLGAKASGRNSGELIATDCWFGRVSQAYFYQRLTRSIHGSYVVKSVVGIAASRASGDFQSAHRGTGKNSRYSWVLVRIRCSYFSCNAGGFLAVLFYHTPIGYCQEIQCQASESHNQISNGSPRFSESSESSRQMIC